MGQSRFLGEFDHTLDDKGRLIVPSKFRNALGDKFYALQSLNAKSIWLMPEAVFESFIGKVSGGIPKTDIKGQSWLRQLTSSVWEFQAEHQGRVLIPQKLRERAGILDPKVKIVGADDHIEIWSAALWIEQAPEQDEFLEQTKAVYAQYGF